MIRVAVIEDNYYTRQAILRAIDWAVLGCVVVGEAPDGLEGERLIRRESPQIVVTDIRMPGYSGIEMVQNLSALPSPPKVIAVTGYQSFAYAQSFLKLGAVDYLLKPLKTEELCEAVRRAVGLIRQEEEAKEELSSLHTELSRSRLSLRAQALSALLLDSSGKEEELRLRLQKAGIASAVYAVAKLIVPGVPALEGLLPALERGYSLKICYLASERQLFLWSERPVSPERFCARALEAMGSLRQKLGECQIGLSRPAKELRQADGCCDRAKGAAEALRLRGEAAVSLAAAREEGELPEAPDIAGLCRSLLAPGEPAALARTAVGGIVESTGSIYAMQNCLIQLCQALLRERPDKDKELPRQVIRKIRDLSSAGEAAQFLEEFLAPLREREQYEECSPLVRAALSYIGSHYQEEITLQTLADTFFLAPAYLSTLIKRQTGKGFVDLLTGVRIERAKELLRDVRLQVQQVSGLVGYRDYAYFYQVFKKQTGLSPKEYRQQNC